MTIPHGRATLDRKNRGVLAVPHALEANKPLSYRIRLPNIMLAKPEDYAKATQWIWHLPEQASAIELPVISAGR